MLNGTVNFLLDRLARGDCFETSLAKARRAGFAEENPDQDLSGRDAEIKLRLIAREAFACAPADLILRRSALTPARVRKFSASSRRWIQLCSLERVGGRVVGSISYVQAAAVVGLPDLPAERNFLRLTLEDGSEVEVSGRGAGGPATAESIMTDLFAYKHLLEARDAARYMAHRRAVSCA